MSYLLLSGRLSHQNWLSLLWLASNFDLSCPSLCCSMASGGLSTSVRSLYCSVDCQMSSQCCPCCPYKYHDTKIYTQIKPCQGKVYLQVPCSNPNKEKEILCLYKSRSEMGFDPHTYLPSACKHSYALFTCMALTTLPFWISPQSTLPDGADTAVLCSTDAAFLCPLSVLFPQQDPHHFSLWCPFTVMFLSSTSPALFVFISLFL